MLFESEKSYSANTERLEDYLVELDKLVNQINYVLGYDDTFVNQENLLKAHELIDYVMNDNTILLEDLIESLRADDE